MLFYSHSFFIFIKLTGINILMYSGHALYNTLKIITAPAILYCAIIVCPSLFTITFLGYCFINVIHLDGLE